MSDINFDELVNDSTGTQVRDAFSATGIDLDEFCPPGANNPGVYGGVQLVDAFKAWDEANPNKIDMNLVSTCMKGSQLRDLFTIMVPPGGAQTSVGNPVQPVITPPTQPVATPSDRIGHGSGGDEKTFNHDIPANLAALNALGNLGETTAWQTNKFATLGDGSKASWDGSTFVAGAAP